MPERDLIQVKYDAKCYYIYCSGLRVEVNNETSFSCAVMALKIRRTSTVKIGFITLEPSRRPAEGKIEPRTIVTFEDMTNIEHLRGHY